MTKGNFCWKNFAERLKTLAFFNILVDFFLGCRIVRLAFINMEIDEFCVLGFGNLSEMVQNFYDFLFRDQPKFQIGKF